MPCANKNCSKRRSLAHNQFNGTVPASLGNLKLMQYMCVDRGWVPWRAEGFCSLKLASSRPVFDTGTSRITHLGGRSPPNSAHFQTCTACESHLRVLLRFSVSAYSFCPLRRQTTLLALTDVDRPPCGDRSTLVHNPLSGDVPPLAALDSGSLDLTGTNVTLASAEVVLIPSDEPVRAGGGVGAAAGALLALVLSLTWLRARRRRMRLLGIVRKGDSVVCARSRKARKACMRPQHTN